MKKGSYDSVAPTLTINSGVIPDRCPFTHPVQMKGLVIDSHSGTKNGLFVVIDDDISTIMRIPGSPFLAAVSSFDFPFALSDLGISVGDHVFAFYAVNSNGCISTARTYSTKVFDATLSASPHPTPTGSISSPFMATQRLRATPRLQSEALKEVVRERPVVPGVERRLREYWDDG
jgi:hypothetical protein